MSNALGVVMLAHEELGRAAEVATHWARHGCAIVVHIDRKTPQGEVDLFLDKVGDTPGVHLLERRIDCKWGHWSLVEASILASEHLLSLYPDLRHVALTSGACVPLRPVDELKLYLDRHPDTDFIESVRAADVPWTIGGLHLERFTLRFPFSWKRQRRAFDSYVRLQRRLKVERRIPDGVEPHLGSQWWCLTSRSLSAILTDPRRPDFDRYFRKTWIPDESYFQTLVRRVSDCIESRSLTLSKFDPQGKPFVFYDDHKRLLQRSGCFIARKIWPGSETLYRTFLCDAPEAASYLEPQPQKIDRILTLAEDRRHRGRPGLFMQSRYPSDTWLSGKTAQPYSVFQGFDEIFVDFDAWLARRTGARAHGHLFDWTKVDVAGEEPVLRGGIPCQIAARDYNPVAFLTNLIWSTRGERQAFHLAPYDRQDINDYIMWDHNAQISVVSGAWAYRLFRSGLPFDKVRQEAAWMQRVEDHFLGKLDQRGLPASIRIWTLAEFLDDPIEALQATIDEIDGTSVRRLNAAPELVDFAGFKEFLQELKNTGMKPYLTGDFAPDMDSFSAPESPRASFVVR